MDLAQWQRRLEKLLTDSPELQDVLVALGEAEDDHEQEVVTKLNGYQAIGNCFQGFTANTVSTVEKQLREGAHAQGPANYLLMLFRVASCFRAFRAANSSFLRGYPLVGFATLRNVKDWALTIAAIGNGITTLTAANGLEQSTPVSTLSPAQMEIIRQRRVKEERRVLDLMLRTPASGLSNSVRQELREWESLFNIEVHAALGFLALEAVPWMMERRASPLLHPRFSEKPMLTFTNRACEVAWMVLRVLPLLQITPGQFGAEWVGMWKTLDESLRFMSSGLAAEGKPIGAAVVELLEKQFSFNPETNCYQASMA